MPVYTYKTFTEAEKALWNFNPDSAYYQRLADLFEAVFTLSPPRCRRGVQGFKSIEEAGLAREELYAKVIL